MRSADSVAVPTPNVALRDLRTESDERTAMNEAADVVHFRPRIAVIELEDDGVGLPAIDAWVCRQVISDEATITWTIDGCACPGPSEVRSDVIPVVLLPVLAAAGPAVRPVGAALSVLDRELVERLLHMAARAGTEQGSIGHRDHTRGLGCGPLPPRRQAL